MSDGRPLTVAVVSKKVRLLLLPPLRWWQHQLTHYREHPKESRRKVGHESFFSQLAPSLQASAHIVWLLTVRRPQVKWSRAITLAN
jgi:hypothetical protein